jgi:hypothetical protein
MKFRVTLVAPLLLLASAPVVRAQVTTPAAPSAEEKKTEEETIVLSPFIVEADDNSSRYKANSTLAGTRLRTDMRDVASPLSVVTAQFMQDVNAHSNQDLLQYTTSTEVGGMGGNYGGFGNQQGLRENDALVRPSSNTRVRGLEQADGTRDFFLSDIPWDSYNTDRIDIQRGPNSILFGVGSPAGIINASTIVAKLGENEGRITNEISSYGSVRFTLDYNHVLLKDQLAFRIAAMDSDRNFRQEPAFNHDRRIYGTVTYQPQLFPKRWSSPLNLRANAERGKIDSNNPRVLPPTDYISLWFNDAAGDGVKDPMGMGKAVYDPYLLESAAFGNVGRGLSGNVLNAFYVPAYGGIDGFGINGGAIVMFYRPGESTPYLATRESNTVRNGIGPDGQIDGTISSISYATLMRSAGWNGYTYNINLMDRNRLAAGEITADQVRFPLADRNYYKDRSLSDPTIFDFYNHLIDGDNKREFNRWTAYNLAASQTFLENRLGFEVVYDAQSYKDGRTGVAWDNPIIAIDINANLQSQYPQYTRVPDPANPANMVVDRSTYTVPGFTPTSSQPYANPNAGAAFAYGGSNGNYSNKIERESTRLTAFAELRGADFFDRESRLAKLIGRHVFTGLGTRERRDFTSTSWRNVATDFAWADQFTTNGAGARLSEGARQVVPIAYLSGPLLGSAYPSAHGLNLGRVTSVMDPYGQYDTGYFNSTWAHPLDPGAPGYVDPASPTLDWFGNTITASEDPRNYINWTKGPAHILSSTRGDIDELYTDYSVRAERIDSVGLTWQGHFANGNIVPTVGWRRDKLVTYTGAGEKDANHVATPHAEADVKALENRGDTTSWGIVAHLPQSWASHLGVVSGLSAYYNRGRNNKVESRYNFDGEPLVNPKAESTDYGIVVSLLKDRLAIKAGHFVTKVKDGNLPGGASLIGDQQYYINQLEAWGTASALMDIFGSAGLDPNQSWYWNWANIDDGANIPANIDVHSSAYLNHPSTVRQRAAIDDFIKGMDQAFYDNYQIPINVAKLQAAYATGDVQAIANAVSGVFPVGSYVTGLNSNGQINGITPNGTIDNTSKGYEVEVNFAPTPQWNLQINLSKTTAYRESLGAAMSSFLEKQYERYSGPAGDLRLWWGGDATVRNYYESNILSALRFQEESVGSQAPELRPWHFAAVTNYNFNGGWRRGLNVGGAWRWDDRQILGYGLKDDRSGLDVNKPLKGKPESSFDMWVGYQHKLTSRITWRTQVNLRNIGKSHGLVPISVDPDGNVAAQRIVDGMTWSFTNSFLF